MKFLLDVNALIALGYKQHVFHKRVSGWAAGKSLASCSITELGFVRILAQLPEVDISVTTSREMLATMRRERRITQISDSQSGVALPLWVQTPRQITDGHLLVLAQSNNAKLATCDEGIP
ncbi:MAG: PIN domain-containing protein, partial [Verrucomicrobiae bacterium]